jgi:hypothetical protein
MGSAEGVIGLRSNPFLDCGILGLAFLGRDPGSASSSMSCCIRWSCGVDGVVGWEGWFAILLVAQSGGVRVLIVAVLRGACQKNLLECWIHSRGVTHGRYTAAAKNSTQKAQQQLASPAGSHDSRHPGFPDPGRGFCGIKQSVEWLRHGLSPCKIPRSD